MPGFTNTLVPRWRSVSIDQPPTKGSAFAQCPPHPEHLSCEDVDLREGGRLGRDCETEGGSEAGGEDGFGGEKDRGGGAGRWIL